MKNILVSGASGIVGYGILRSLRKSSEKYCLIGTTIYSDSIAPAFCDIFEQAPMTADKSYISWLCSIIKKHNIDLIIPGIELDMFKWSAEREKLGKTGAKSLLNNSGLIDLCGDKWLFYEKLKKKRSKLVIESKINGSFNELTADLGMPFLLKPRRGFASRGIVKVESNGIFIKHSKNFGPILMAQPIIGNDNEEYTASAFFDDKSNLCCHMTLRRKLSKEGYTEKAQVLEIPGMPETLQLLARIFKPIGPTNFQFRKHHEDLKLLEINPRISSSTSIRAAFGYNEAVMSVNYYLHKQTPTQPTIRPGIAIRYAEEHIFYDRDNF